MPKNKSFDDPRYSQWLRKRVMKWRHAATAKAVMFLTFDIDVFIFTYLDTVQLC